MWHLAVKQLPPPPWISVARVWVHGLSPVRPGTIPRRGTDSWRSAIGGRMSSDYPVSLGVLLSFLLKRVLIRGWPPPTRTDLEHSVAVSPDALFPMAVTLTVDQTRGSLSARVMLFSSCHGLGDGRARRPAFGNVPHETFHEDMEARLRQALISGLLTVCPWR